MIRKKAPADIFIGNIIPIKDGHKFTVADYDNLDNLWGLDVVVEHGVPRVGSSSGRIPEDVLESLFK